MSDAEPSRPEATGAQQPEDEHQPTGLDLARSIARGLAGRTAPRELTLRRAGDASGRGRPPAAAPTPTTAIRRPSTSPSAGSSSDQGWETELRVHGVFSRWEAIVGREVAQHVTPESFADGRLVVRTDSTAWATQMKLLAADVVRRLNEVLGDETVRVIDVAGPRAPSWKKGRLRVKGRGPRDTYG